MKTIFTLVPPVELISIAFSLLCLVGAMAMEALRARLKGQNFTALFDKLDRLATIVVLEIEQTVVQPAKQQAESGKLTPELAKIIKMQAVQRLMALLGNNSSDLRKAFGDVESAVETLIEAKVREMRLLQTGRKVK